MAVAKVGLVLGAYLDIERAPSLLLGPADCYMACMQQGETCCSLASSRYASKVVAMGKEVRVAAMEALARHCCSPRPTSSPLWALARRSLLHG
jgi:hypothetical protein